MWNTGSKSKQGSRRGLGGLETGGDSQVLPVPSSLLICLGFFRLTLPSGVSKLFQSRGKGGKEGGSGWPGVLPTWLGTQRLLETKQ